MVLVDSTVWIGWFNGVDCWQTNALDDLIDNELIAVGDLILVEVLQGFRSEKDFRTANRLLSSQITVPLCDVEVAIEAARHFRFLCTKGITVRKTIDTVIAAACIRAGWRLLHNDRDFDPFEEFLGLQVVSPGTDKD
jgi:predicted nucleic acid-binding protein